MHRRPTIFLLVALLVATSLAIGGVPGVAAVVATDYTFTRIGGPDAGNLWTQGFDVNNGGTVVGQLQSENINGLNEQAFRWTSGGGVELLPLPGVTRSNAYAVNDAGQIAGYIFVGGNQHAYIWSPTGGMTDLGTLPGGTISTAYALNDAGVVVGYANDTNGDNHAFRWTAVGGMVPLTLPAGYFSGSAVGINSDGDIVGTAYTTPDNINYFWHVFVWPAGGGAAVNLGTLPGGSYSGASGINDEGQVTGIADDANGEPHVFLWSETTGMVDLGLPPGGYTDVSVNAINNLGQLAGYATATSNGDEHAFVWFPTGLAGQGQFFVLGDFDGDQGEIFGNNDKGQLVGYTSNSALGSADRLQGFLLTPNDMTAPTTVATPTGTPGNGGWSRSNVTVNLAATDNPGGFGVARIAYGATGAQPIPTTNAPGATAAPVISAEGETILTFYATDYAGNVESARTLTVRIDKTGPMLTTTLAPPIARPGDTVGITVASNESLAATPTLVATGPCIATTTLTMSAGGSPNAYASSYLVPTGTMGCTITFTAAGADPAGNPSSGGSPAAALVVSCVSAFGDVSDDALSCLAIAALTDRGIIQGYDTNPPTFGPDDDVQRAQVAAFLVRALGWQGRPTGPHTFDDFDGLVAELRTSALIVANACTDPANDATCVAQGYGDGRFGITDPVSHAQVITFIARAFGFDPNFAWAPQPAGAQPYAGVPGDHDSDIRTYHHYAGTIPDAPTTADEWHSPATREWVARVLYQALQAAP